jgi:hypothetical protein
VRTLTELDRRPRGALPAWVANGDDDLVAFGLVLRARARAVLRRTTEAHASLTRALEMLAGSLSRRLGDEPAIHATLDGTDPT